ncbi:unnamed protein product [Adineta steineri]|uniref:Uncharacterized protein n=1 Tax=Adineta steineri TaxID=433720 RepID=A0A819PBI2_9BILA|nr:unnamed protein product [Adineta steineri]CAF4011217.1 unnamed protein product [Adineta steineri]
MTDERQLETFDARELATIAKLIKELQPDNSLAAFSNISDMIKKATGMLPANLIPIIQKLSDSYSNTTMLIKANFAHTADILSKFVVKGYRVMQRGMKNDDRKVLMNLEQELNTGIINKLDALVESSRSELTKIHGQLSAKAHGGRAVDLLKKRDCRVVQRIRCLEKTVENRANTDLTSRVIDARNKLAIYEAKNSSLKHKDPRAKEMYGKANEEFYLVDEEIKKIYKSIGTANINNLKVIDELCRAVLSGLDSILLAYGKIRYYLNAIDIDEDLLGSSILVALRFMNVADAYMETRRIHHIKQVLLGAENMYTQSTDKLEGTNETSTVTEENEATALSDITINETTTVIEEKQYMGYRIMDESDIVH